MITVLYFESLIKHWLPPLRQNHFFIVTVSSNIQIKHCKTPLEVRMETLSTEHPTEYTIPRNKRIEINGMHRITTAHFDMYGRYSALHFRYLTCLLDRGHIIL